jgi:hypothetical protein
MQLILLFMATWSSPVYTATDCVPAGAEVFILPPPPDWLWRQLSRGLFPWSIPAGALS